MSDGIECLGERRLKSQKRKKKNEMGVEGLDVDDIREFIKSNASDDQDGITL